MDKYTHTKDSDLSEEIFSELQRRIDELYYCVSIVVTVESKKRGVAEDYNQ